MWWHFEPIYGTGDKTITSKCRCNLCGTEVETGAMNLHDHLMQCNPYREKTTIDLSPEAGERALKIFFKTGKL